MITIDGIIPPPEFTDEIGISAPAEVVWRAVADPAVRARWDAWLDAMVPAGAEGEWMVRRHFPLLGSMESRLVCARDGEMPRVFSESAMVLPRWLRWWEYRAEIVAVRNRCVVRMRMRVCPRPFFLRRVGGAFFTGRAARALVLLKNVCETG